MVKCVAYAMGEVLPSNVDDPRFEERVQLAGPSLVEDTAEAWSAHAWYLVIDFLSAAGTVFGGN